MAHLGKVYRRHFHRDLSYRSPNGMNYLPEHVYQEQQQLYPPVGTIWPQVRCKSDPASSDLTTGITTWQMIPPSGATPGLAIRFEHRLTFNVTFVETRAYLSYGGVDLWYLKSVGGSNFIGSYEASGFFTVLTALQPSQPTGALAVHRLVWADE
jgi:hypothetical protein